jgi:hypothetical protein
MRVSIWVHYSTEGRLHRNGPSRTFESTFGSLDAAKSAPLPNGCTSACILLDDGSWTYSKLWGWEFHETLFKQSA